MIFGGLFAISALQIFYQIGEDVFLPLYANLLKPKIASLLNFFGVPYPSFAGDNSVSQYTLLQRQQDFIRESTDREQEMLRKLQESQKAQQEMKDQLNGLRKEVDTLQGIPVDLPSK
ncbi:MAG: hypothetical protein HYT77_02310 [Deltaproteobacteria bacterium]|nr:hypothetical protein [Deltaproteobacteria bacterium]